MVFKGNSVYVKTRTVFTLLKHFHTRFQLIVVYRRLLGLLP